MKCKDNEHCECDGEGVCRNSMTTPQETMEERFDKELCEKVNGILYLRNWNTHNENLLPTPYEILSFIKSEIEKARQEERERCIDGMIELITKRKAEYHKDCLDDMFINGRFWEAQELWQILQSEKENIIKSLTPKGDK